VLFLNTLKVPRSENKFWGFPVTTYIRRRICDVTVWCSFLQSEPSKLDKKKAVKGPMKEFFLENQSGLVRTNFLFL